MKVSKNKLKLDLSEIEKLRKLPDDEIDFSEIPELDNVFWGKATIILNKEQFANFINALRNPPNPNEVLTKAFRDYSQMFHEPKKATKQDIAIGSWLSAAMEDEKVCAEMKKDIEDWFNQFDIFGDENDDLELPIDETR